MTGDAEKLARVTQLVNEWQGQCDAIAITYQDAVAREQALGVLQAAVFQLRRAMRDNDVD